MKHPQEEVDILSEGFTKFTSTIDQVKSSKSILLKALSDIEKIEHTYFRTRIARENNVVRRTDLRQLKIDISTAVRIVDQISKHESDHSRIMADIERENKG